jgi:nicotinamide mononucleotide transporter
MAHKKIGFDAVWVIALSMLALLFCLITKADLFSSSILISGVGCVGLIAIGRKAGYLVGLYNSLAYAWIAYQNALFGEVALNLLFYVPTGILGFVLWKRHSSHAVVIMRRLTWLKRGWLLFGCLLGMGLFGWVLSRIPTQNNPFIDASTNVLSIVATFLMIGRFKEQWLLYIALNIISVLMWTLRWRADGMAGDTMIFMWILYLLNSFFGYWRWSRGAIQTAE